MARSYRMTERAQAHDETRQAIVLAAMHLHDEQGVAATSFVDIAKRAGIGAATVYRHFPAIGDLVRACGAHVWAEMQPPLPAAAAAQFAGVEGMEARLLRLAETLDAFYRRGALRLAKAAADRETIPELEQFLGAVAAGVEAHVREAVRGERLDETALQLLLALTEFPVWQSLQRTGVAPQQFPSLLAGLLSRAIGD